MAAGDMALRLLIEGNSTSALGAVNGLSGALSSLASNPMMAVVTAATVATVAVAGFGVTSTKMAADFQTSMNMLVTSAGESQSNLKMVSDGVLKMSVDTATSTDQLAKGMYMVESAGYHGAQGLTVLGVGARGAKAEGADLGTVLFTLTGILQDYHMGADQSTQAMNALNVAVGSGKMHLQDLSMSLGTILPLAASLHIKLEDVLGATASMTNSNTTAALATQHLAFVLSALSAPGKQAVKYMAEVGLTAQQVKDSLSTNGLAGTLQMIEEHVGSKFPANSVESVTALKKIMGGVVGWKTELALTGGNMAAFENNVKNIGLALHKGGNDVLGWDVVQQSFNFKIGQAKNAFDALMITLGTKLLPILGPIVDAITPIITGFTNWLISGNRIQDAMDTVGSILQQVGGVLQQAFIPIWQTLVDVWQHQLMPAFKEIYDALLPIMPTLKAFGTAIMTIVVVAIIILIRFIAGAITLFADFVRAAAGIIKVFQDIFQGNWKALGADILAAFKNIFGGILGMYQSAEDKAKEAQLQTQIHTDTMKVQSITNAQQMAIGTIKHMQLMKDGIIAELKNTKDPAKRHHLEMQLDAINAAQRTEEGVVAHMQQQKVASLKHIQELKDQAIEAHKSMFEHVTDWVGRMASSVGNWFKNAWGGLGAWLGGVLNNIVNGVKGFIDGVKTNIVNGFNFVKDSVLRPITDIVGFFKWLYDHNYYFKDLVDSIVNFFKGALAWVQDAWKTAVKWLTDRWNELAGFASAAWQKVSDVFSSIWNTYIAGPLGSLWNSFQAWLVDLAARVIFGFHIMWQKVSDLFMGIWNTYVAKPLGSLWNSISKWFTDLGTGAQQSGQNFIQMLVNGISSGAGAIWNAVTGIAQNIWKALGFHSPTEAGPGADADRWMPNLINLLVGGLNAGVPAMHRAALNVAAPLAQIGGGSGNSFGLSGAGGNAFALSGSNGNAFALGNGGQTIIVQVQPATANITMDHRKVGEGVMNYAQKEVRIQGNIRNR